MSGINGPSENNEKLRVLAGNAGIPELEAFEHDSGELEVAQNELRDKLNAVDTTNELLEDPFFGDEEEADDLDEEDFRVNKTVH